MKPKHGKFTRPFKEKWTVIDPKLDATDMVTIQAVCFYVEVSQLTIKNWYTWLEAPDHFKPAKMPKMPKIYRKSRDGVRYWKKSEVPYLLVFREWLRGEGWGAMADYNAYFWGKRGEKRMEALKEKLAKEGKENTPKKGKAENE